MPRPDGRPANKPAAPRRPPHSASKFYHQYVAPGEWGTGSEMIGRRLGPYKIVRSIGEGGMGAVFLGARADREFEKQVAIKLVLRGAESLEIVDRFRQERQTLASLDHPNIVRLLDGGTSESGLPYLVMDYVEGEPILDYCRKRGLTLGERLRLFLLVSDAVHYAHQHLVVHRDIKPGNLLVTTDGMPRLLDFGIAAVLKRGAGEGAEAGGASSLSLRYASPGRHTLSLESGGRNSFEVSFSTQ